MNTVDFKKYPFVYNGTALKSFANRALKEKYLVKNAPLSQVPFLIYYGHTVEEESIRKDVKYGLWEILSIGEVLSLIKRAQANGSLRDLVEAFASFTPTCSDILLQTDLSDLTYDEPPKITTLSSFHSYNRKYVRTALDEIGRSKAPEGAKKCLLLPCSAHRPYNTSKTHQEIYQKIQDMGLDLNSYYKVVVTTIGPVPEDYWQHPFILSYNNSYPDLWQVYERCKVYFSNNKFDEYLNFHRYEPFVEIIKLCGISQPTEMKKIKGRV